MEPAAIKLVQALIDEEAMSSCEHSSAFGKQDYWNRVTNTLDCTYHEHCEARGLPRRCSSSPSASSPISWMMLGSS